MVQTSISSWLTKPGTDKAASLINVEQDERPTDVSTEPPLADSADTTPPQANMTSIQPIPSTAQTVIQSYQNVHKLPPEVVISSADPEHINSIKRMNATALPIPYQDSFYNEILTDPVVASITKVALWRQSSPSAQDGTGSGLATKDSSPRSSPLVVAAIRCRLIADPTTAIRDPALYISTITTLALFRGFALATHLLSAVCRTAVEEYGITSVVAHVWEANVDALKWYEHRGFEVISREKDYYRRLAPRTTALVVRKSIGPTDMLSWT